jgi:flagellar assembly protein FliH
MSSSKVIRRGGELHLTYDLEPIGSPRKSFGHKGFRAIQLGVAEELEPEPEEVEEIAEELPPCIPEEEALRRIEQAELDGVKKGKRQAEAELAKVSDALAQALLATGSLRGQLLHEAEDDLLKLSVLIARKIVLRELTTDPGVLADLVRGALDLAAEGGEVVVRLNPEEYAVVIKCREFEELLSEKRGIALKGDPAVGRAGCLVETARGNFDAGMEAQLDEIFRRLTEERSARKEEPADD